MGCVCCSLSSFVSILLDALERISLCTVCAMLTCCLLFTLITMLVMGIGIGFHYCFVQNSVDSMAKAAKAAGALRTGAPKGYGNVMRAAERAVRRGFAHRVDRSRRELNSSFPTNGIFNDTDYLYANNTYNDTLYHNLTDLYENYASQFQNVTALVNFTVY